MTPGEFGRAAEDNAEDLVKFARDMAEQDTQIAYGKFVAAEKDRLWAESALKDAQRNLDALRAQWAEFCGPLGDALARAWQDYAFDVLRRDWERERCRSGEGLRGRPPSLVPPPLPRDGFDLPPLPQPKSGDR